MRVISGSHKGRIITAPRNLPVRPTTDMGKESLFNILMNRFDLREIAALDLFCGTGNISYEFASRGCPDITSVDSNQHCYEFVIDTARKLNFTAIHVLRANVFSFLQTCNKKFDIIFADPPFELEKIEKIPILISEQQLLKPGGTMIIEHGPRTNLSLLAGFLEKRNYGKVNFSIFG